jgi:hypothetical protein
MERRMFCHMADLNLGIEWGQGLGGEVLIKKHLYKYTGVQVEF